MSPDTEHLLLEAARAQATVPDQLTAIVIHLADFRLEMERQIAALGARLDLHMGKCSLVHPMLDARLKQDERDIQRLQDAATAELQRERTTLTTRNEVLIAAEAANQHHEIVEIKDSRKYWNRTSVTVAVSVALGLLAAGVGLAQVAVRIWH